MMDDEVIGKTIAEQCNQYLRFKKKSERTGQNINNTYNARVKPFFHLQDPILLKEMSRTMGISMCRDWIPNTPNYVEVYERTQLSGRITKKYSDHDSYCGVSKRGWQYGTKGKKGEYDGDAWSEKVEEFMRQPDHRRCPFCEAIYKQVSLETILKNRK